MAAVNPESRDSGFGVLSHVVKDNIYVIGQSGFIYTAPWIATEATRAPSVALIVSASKDPFKLLIGGRELHTHAALIPPFVPRSLYGRNVPLVCFHVMPNSPHYDAFSHLTQRDNPIVDRKLFSLVDPELEQLYRGVLPPAQAPEVYETAVRLPIQHLRSKPLPDARVLRVRELLNAGAEPTLSELADDLGISYFWASRMMAKVFGMSLRDYKAWCKQQRVFYHLHSDKTLTEIAHAAGFTDSAHLSRTYQRWFGQPPSYSRNRNHVNILRC